MSDGLDPDAVRSRTFSTARRGFERAEVEAFQHEVADRLGALQTELAQLQDSLRQVGFTELPRLKEEFDTVGEDVREILQTARAAAEDMRDRADALA